MISPSKLTETRYDGSVIVERSMELAEPVIYVSMNYRYVGIAYFWMFNSELLLQS